MTEARPVPNYRRAYVITIGIGVADRHRCFDFSDLDETAME